MKKLFVVLMMVLCVSVFAQYRYDLTIEGTTTIEIDVEETYTGIKTGAENVFIDPDVKMNISIHNDLPKVTITITGTLPVTKKIDTVEFTGTAGGVNITFDGATAGVILTEETELADVLTEFVSTYSAYFRARFIVLSNTDTAITFTSIMPGIDFTSPTVEDINGNLSGNLVNTQANVMPNLDNLDNVIYKYFDQLINITDFENHHNRDWIY